MVGQWGPAVDPLEMIKAISVYEDRIVSAAGLKVDVTRQAADVRSGLSLVVSRDSVREAQRTCEPLFERSDLRTLRITASLLGNHDEAAEADARIDYQGLPVSPQERRALVQEVRDLRDAGLISKVEAWQRLHPGASEDEARKALANIDAEGRGEAA